MKFKNILSNSKTIKIIISTIFFIWLVVWSGVVINTITGKGYSAEKIISKMKKDVNYITIEDIIKVNASNDEEKLLKKENEYISKVTFDSGMIEVFKNTEDLELRLFYWDKLFSRSKNILSKYGVLGDKEYKNIDKYIIIREKNALFYLRNNLSESEKKLIDSFVSVMSKVKFKDKNFLSAEKREEVIKQRIH